MLFTFWWSRAEHFIHLNEAWWHIYMLLFNKCYNGFFQSGNLFRLFKWEFILTIEVWIYFNPQVGIYFNPQVGIYLNPVQVRIYFNLVQVGIYFISILKWEFILTLFKWELFVYCSFMFDEPSSYLDVKQRLRAAQAIRNLIAANKYIIVVEHDLSVLDYLSDFICCLYGVPGAYGVVTMPFSVREGANFSSLICLHCCFGSWSMIKTNLLFTFWHE